MNKQLISIPSFSFIQNNINNNLNSEVEYINDEIYPNENFDIKIPDNDLNIITNKKTKSQENKITNYLESPKKLSTYDKKSSPFTTIIKGENNFYISNNLNLNNKFNNLQISSISTLEIKSSYDNINEFTNYRFISDSLLIKKTKIFLSKECNILYDINTKSVNMPCYSPINNNRMIKSQSAIKNYKDLNNKNFYDYDNRMNNLSIINDNDTNSLSPFSNEFKKIEFNKTDKNNDKFLENSFKDSKESNLNEIKKNASIKEENESIKKRNSLCSNTFSSFSPKKARRKPNIALDSSISIKTKFKLDLIMKNMKRDNQNLNNPNEFYADLFNNFYKKKIKKNESKPSIHKLKLTQNTEEKNSSEEKGIEDKEDDKKNSLEDS